MYIPDAKQHRSFKMIATQMIQSQNGESFSGSKGLLDWQLSCQPEQNVVLLQTSGPIDKTSFPAMLAAAVAAMDHHQCSRLLGDHRNSALKLDPLEIYYAPRVIIASGASAGYSVALVFPEITEDLQFMENVCRNSGLHLAVFTDVNGALQWFSASTKPLTTPPHSARGDAEKSNG